MSIILTSTEEHLQGISLGQSFYTGNGSVFPQLLIKQTDDI